MISIRRAALAFAAAAFPLDLQAQQAVFEHADENTGYTLQMMCSGNFGPLGRAYCEGLFDGLREQTGKPAVGIGTFCVPGETIPSNTLMQSYIDWAGRQKVEALITMTQRGAALRSLAAAYPCPRPVN